MESYTQLFKALGQTTRMQIVKVLAEQAMCVCELEEILKMNQPRISQHLRILRHAGVVTEREESPWRIYSVDKKALDAIWDSFKGFLNSPLADTPGFENEAEVFTHLQDRLRVNLSTKS